MKTLLSFILLAFISVNSFGQVDPLYAQYLYNPLLINPAYTGSNKYLNIMADVRKQWAGFDGSPTTINLTAHTSLLDNKMGVGLMIVKDQIGENNNTLIQATYGYKLDLGGTYLSFGLEGGIVNYRSDNFSLNPYDENDAVFLGKQNYTKPTFGAGLMLKNDKMLFGLSVPRMLQAKQTFESLPSGSVEAKLYTQHYYAFGSMVFYLTERIRMKPAVLFKYVKGSPISTDLNVQMILNEQVSVGALTRNLNTYGLMGQLKFSQGYKLAYVLEVPANNSVGFRFTSHELTLGLNLGLFGYHDIYEASDF